MGGTFDFTADFATTNRQAPMVIVEANAGTGKTYSIEHLYCELLERLQGLTVERLLVMTFTEAATAELKNRIREQLARTADMSRPARLALASFDLAPIFTIHGFCKRALENFAFESGADFEARLDNDSNLLLEEAVRDYYNRKAAAGEPTDGFDSLLAVARQVFAEPAPKLVPDVRTLKTDERDAARRALVTAVRETPPPARASKFKTALQNVQATLGAANAVEKILAEPELFGSTAKRNALQIAAAKRKLNDVEQGLALAEFLRFLDDPRTGFLARKTRANAMTFDDLLSKVREALDGDGGARFADALRAEYKVVIVDEFQDTDPTQYGIFERVFNRPGWLFFMFGDPKQAIYSFRSGDLATYLKAKRAVVETDADSAYQLAANYRSMPKMVAAVNDLFRVPHPFLDSGIAYVDSVCGLAEKPTELKHRLLVDGHEMDQPMRLLWMTGARGATGQLESLSKTAVGDLFLDRTAQEIARLLQDDHYTILAKGATCARRLRPSDFAVLVEENAQCRTVKEKLNQVGVPAVVLKAGNVFASQDAKDLAFILEAILRPGNLRLVKSAFLTAWCGVKPADVAAFDSAEIEAKRELLAELGAVWRRHGVAAVAAAFLQRFNGLANIVRTADFERRIVNWRHLVELLRAEETASNLEPEGVVKFLHGRLSDGAAADAHEERLDSDADAVTVLTVFKSKGLEYPIVFCPTISTGFAELHAGRMSRTHNAAGELILPIGEVEKEKAFPQARFESFSERLRLLYVALTRSACACFLLGGNIHFGRDKSQRTAFNYLVWMRGRRGEELPDWHDLPTFAAPTPLELQDLSAVMGVEMADYETYAATEVVRYQPIVDTPVFRPADTPPTVPRDFAVMSYSGMVEHTFESRAVAGGGCDEPEVDAAPADETTPDPLPGGTQVGTAVHEVFELCDFLSDAGRAEIVERALARNGIGDDAAQARRNRVLEMVGNTLRTRLPGCDFALDTICRADTKREWTFFSAVTKPVELEIFKANFPGLSFKPGAGELQGCITGSIDLIFRRGERYYFVDWKTDRLTDYSPAALERELTNRGYRFQAYVYAIALRDFLKSRLGAAFDFDRHFGGGFYCFVRGIAAGEGIARFRPTAAELDTYAACFREAGK